MNVKKILLPYFLFVYYPSFLVGAVFAFIGMEEK